MMGYGEKERRYQMNARISLISMSNIYRDGGYNGMLGVVKSSEKNSHTNLFQVHQDEAYSSLVHLLTNDSNIAKSR